MQDMIQKTDSQTRDDNSQDRCNDDRCPDGLPDPTVIFCPEKLGTQCRQTADHAGDESEDQEQQRGGRADDRCQRFLPQFLSHDPGIRDHIQLMKYIPDQKGDRKEKQQFCGGTAGHVFHNKMSLDNCMDRQPLPYTRAVSVERIIYHKFFILQEENNLFFSLFFSVCGDFFCAQECFFVSKETRNKS